MTSKKNQPQSTELDLRPQNTGHSYAWKKALAFECEHSYTQEEYAMKEGDLKTNNLSSDKISQQFSLR